MANYRLGGLDALSPYRSAIAMKVKLPELLGTVGFLPVIGDSGLRDQIRSEGSTELVNNEVINVELPTTPPARHSKAPNQLKFPQQPGSPAPAPNPLNYPIQQATPTPPSYVVTVEKRVFKTFAFPFAILDFGNEVVFSFGYDEPPYKPGRNFLTSSFTVVGVPFQGIFDARIPVDNSLTYGIVKDVTISFAPFAKRVSNVDLSQFINSYSFCYNCLNSAKLTIDGYPLPSVFSIGSEIKVCGGSRIGFTTNSPVFPKLSNFGVSLDPEATHTYGHQDIEVLLPRSGSYPVQVEITRDASFRDKYFLGKIPYYFIWGGNLTVTVQYIQSLGTLGVQSNILPQTTQITVPSTPIISNITLPVVTPITTPETRNITPFGIVTKKQKKNGKNVFMPYEDLNVLHPTDTRQIEFGQLQPTDATTTYPTFTPTSETSRVPYYGLVPPTDRVPPFLPVYPLKRTPPPTETPPDMPPYIPTPPATPPKMPPPPKSAKPGPSKITNEPILEQPEKTLPTFNTVYGQCPNGDRPIPFEKPTPPPKPLVESLPPIITSNPQFCPDPGKQKMPFGKPIPLTEEEVRKWSKVWKNKNKGK